MQQRNRLNIISWTLVACALAGCGESRQINDLRDQVRQGRLDEAAKTADDLYGSNSDEALPKAMDLGLVKHLQGDFAGSDVELDRAAPLVDDLRGSHVGDAIASSLLNDTVTTYVGRPFEHTQVDYYRTLNSLLSAQIAEKRWIPPSIVLPAGAGVAPTAATDAAKAYEKAIIVARRMTINQLKETADAAGSNAYDDDPFARLLAAVAVLCLDPATRTESDQQFTAAMLTRAITAYAAQAKSLNAQGHDFRYEVSAEPALATTLYLRHLRSYDPDLFTTELSKRGWSATDPRVSPPAGSGMVLVLDHAGLISHPEPLQIGIAALGFASADAQTFSWGAVSFYAKGPGSKRAPFWPILPIPGEVVQKCLAPGGAAVIGFELPSHADDLPNSGPSSVRSGTVQAQADVVCDLDAYARAQLNDAQPGILLKTVLRVAAKQTLVAIASSQANRRNNDGGLLGFVINLAGSAIATATESADLRAWNTLPDRIGAALIDLPAGTHPLSITTTNGTYELGPVQVQAGRLTLVSVRTFPSR